jgi:hypothetical protein
LVVQLVRIPACHAGGRGFESRPDRKIWEALQKRSAFLPKYLEASRLTQLCCLPEKSGKGLVVRPMKSFPFLEGFFDLMKLLFLIEKLISSGKV